MNNAVGKPAWCYRFLGLDAKYHRVRTDAQTREQTEALLRQQLAQLSIARAKGLHSLDHLKPVIFGDFYRDTYIATVRERVRESTVQRKEYAARYVLPFFGCIPLRAINAGHVSEFMAKRSKDTPKPSSREINIERGLVSAVLHEAFRHGLVDTVEAARVRPLKERGRDLWLTREDIGHILEHAEEWVKPFIVFGVHTGMRRGELCNLRWADLEHSPGWIRVDAPKTGSVRFVPLNATARGVIAGLARRIGTEGPIPFVFVNGRFMNCYKPDSVYHSFKAACQRAARALEETGKDPEGVGRLRGATFHTLRHSFASWSIQAGIPIADVQHYLGHHSDVMTRLYAHLAPIAKERRNALEVLVSGDSIGARMAQEACAERATAVTS
jgi:integrase